jgi:NADH dehydrogenase
MKASLLITGAGGFVGRQLLQKIDIRKYRKIYCLSRKPESILHHLSSSENVEIVEEDLLEISAWQHLLKDVDTVIHMAAVTGKKAPKEYFNVNAYGTLLLLDRSKEAGVKHFLLVSSIAVSFTNKYRYFYALSKEQAENYVKSSGLNYTILRPTMIMGRGSQVFEGLAKLTKLPVIPIFGKGKTTIQPIHVDDVAKAIREIEEEARFHGEVLEMGGSDSITIKDFMKNIAVKRKSKNPRFLHLPLGIIIFFLSILERMFFKFLPLTVGQLASFRNDGTIKKNTLFKKLSPLMLDINEMIETSLSREDSIDRTDPQFKECLTFCRYLLKQDPNEYVFNKYKECHQKTDLEPKDFCDAFLLKAGKSHPFFTKLTDIYSRFFHSNSAIRKKLAYLMAILETSPPYYRFYDSTDKKGKYGFIFSLGIKGVVLALQLFFSFLFFFPLQILSKILNRGPEAEKTNG